MITLSAEQIEYLESLGYSEPVGIDDQIWAFHPGNASGVMPSPIPEAIAQKVCELQLQPDLQLVRSRFGASFIRLLRRLRDKDWIDELEHFCAHLRWNQRKLWILEKNFDNETYFDSPWSEVFVIHSNCEKHPTGRNYRV